MNCSKERNCNWRQYYLEQKGDRYDQGEGDKSKSGFERIKDTYKSRNCSQIQDCCGKCAVTSQGTAERNVPKGGNSRFKGFA
jgi:hypothetical protein